MAISNLISDAKQRMHSSVETVRKELASMRTGRASSPCWTTCAWTTTARPRP
jgi:ribosome recycling factor